MTQQSLLHCIAETYVSADPSAIATYSSAPVWVR